MNLNFSGGPNISLWTDVLAVLFKKVFPWPCGIKVRDITAPASLPLLFKKLQSVINNFINAICISSTDIAADHRTP